MAAPDLDAVCELTVKAILLDKKGHTERGVEKQRRALAAAEALGAEDCIIVASIKAEIALVLAIGKSRTGEPATRASVLELFALCTESAATLRRRRDAGTLLPGTCRPDEVRWLAECMRGALPDISLARRSAEAPLVGYKAFIRLVNACAVSFALALISGLFQRGLGADWACVLLLFDLWDEAVELMSAVTAVPLNDLTSVAEGTLLKQVSALSTAMAQVPVLGVWHERLQRGLVRLHQSGVVARRGLDGQTVRSVQAIENTTAARNIKERARAAAAGELRSCALASCGAKEAHVAHFGKCVGCKAVVYCSVAHQKDDWPAHKAACKAARKAAAASSASA